MGPEYTTVELVPSYSKTVTLPFSALSRWYESGNQVTSAGTAKLRSSSKSYT